MNDRSSATGPPDDLAQFLDDEPPDLLAQRRLSPASPRSDPLALVRAGAERRVAGPDAAAGRSASVMFDAYGYGGTGPAGDSPRVSPVKSPIGSRRRRCCRPAGSS